MLTLVALPCYFTINQSENCAPDDHVPGMPLRHLAFKNALLKLFGEFRILKHEPSILLYNKPALLQ